MTACPSGWSRATSSRRFTGWSSAARIRKGGRPTADAGGTGASARAAPWMASNSSDGFTGLVRQTATPGSGPRPGWAESWRIVTRPTDDCRSRPINSGPGKAASRMTSGNGSPVSQARVQNSNASAVAATSTGRIPQPWNISSSTARVAALSSTTSTRNPCSSAGSGSAAAPAD